MSSSVQEVHPSMPDTSRRWTFTASISSIISAFIASACCVGPLVFTLLGIGGAGLLVRFEPYRPYFTVLTLGLLGLGFYFAYRPSRVPAAANGPACDCPTRRAIASEESRSGLRRCSSSAS